MEQILAYIQSKVDKIDERMDGIDKTLAVNTSLLDIHIKRTDLLEKEVKFVKTHVIFVQLLSKLVAWSLGVLAAMATVLSLLHLI